MNYLTPKEAHKIIDNVCEEYMITLDSIKTKSRIHEISEARAIICYILYGKHGYSPSHVGRIINSVHGSVITASGRVTDEMETNSKYKIKIERLVKKFDIN